MTEIPDKLFDLIHTSKIAPSEFIVLAILIQRGGIGVISPAAISHATDYQMSVNQAEKVLRGLRKRGLVSREVVVLDGKKPHYKYWATLDAGE
jgi:DNA-binding MarR family transcriptional regulator